jgi:hypothetical protein
MVFVALEAMLLPAAAQATITVGSNLAAPLAPGSPIGGDITAFAVSPPAGSTLSPVNGTVTGGHLKQGSMSSGDVSLRIAHRLANGDIQVIATGPDNLFGAGAGTYPLKAGIPVAAGDIVAIRASLSLERAITPGAAYRYQATSSAPVGGTPVAPFGGFSDSELLYNAQIDPTNSFTVGAPTGGRKGRADVVVTVPNPGRLDAGAINDNRFAVSAKKKRKKKSKPVLTRDTITPTSAGRVTLALTVSGAGRRILRKKGKLKTTVKFVYTPTGGSPSTQSIPLKLKR